MNDEQNRAVSTPVQSPTAQPTTSGSGQDHLQRIPHDGELSAQPSAQVITPQAAPQPTVVAVPDPVAAAATPVQSAVPVPESSNTPVVPVPDTAAAQADQSADQAPAQPAGGFFKADATDASTEAAPNRMADAAFRPLPQTALAWVAGDDGPAHSKPAGWYGLLVLGSVIISALVYLVTRDVVSTVVVGMVCIGFGIVSVRKPHALHYSIDGRSMIIGNHHYDFNQFRSFSIMEDSFGRGALLVPLKRFMPTLSVRFDGEQADAIINALSERLPMEQHRSDAIDKIARTIRF